VVAPPDDEAGLAPGEQARIDQAVVRVARRGRGPTIAAALVVAAFLVGLVRPWDWLAGGAASDPVSPPTAGVGGATTERSGSAASVAPSLAADGDPTPLSGAPTCGYPASWRTSTIQLWAGERARVWTAAEAAPASGVDDPSIPFNLIASDTVEAIGWCAPVSGADRPPLAAEATLFRFADGTWVEAEVDRLEPVARDALGELWLPPGQAGERPPSWAPGRYIIRLAVPSGGYERYMGLAVGLPERSPEPSATPAPAPSTTAEPSTASPVPAGTGPVPWS
jgi:hypothetical protein